MATRKKRPTTRAPRPRSTTRSKPVPEVGTPRLTATLRAVSEVLGRLEFPSAVIGGIAVIAWGFARTTTDIDCAIAAPLDAAARIETAFRKAGFRARLKDSVAFAQDSHLLGLTDPRTGIDVDVSLAQLTFEHEALSEAPTVDFAGVSIQVPSVTDLLIYKVVAGRERDLRDAASLMDLGHEVDAARIERLLAEFDAILDTDRLGDWQRLRRKSV